MCWRITLNIIPIPKIAEDNFMLCNNYPRDWKGLYQLWHRSSGTPFCLQSLMWVVLGILTAVLFCTWCRKCMITKGAPSRTLKVVQNHDAHKRKTKKNSFSFLPLWVNLRTCSLPLQPGLSCQPGHLLRLSSCYLQQVPPDHHNGSSGGTSHGMKKKG